MRGHITRARLVCLTLAALAGVGGGSLGADVREDPMDVIVALDKSLSMVEEIEAVKQYATDVLVKDLLIPGDFFIIICFYGKTELLVTDVVGTSATKDQIADKIAEIAADGRFTDIGNALDELKRQLDARGRAGIPKHLLLITDGKQEAPPESKYWAPDGSFTHEFLENTRVIQKEGWKVHVLGIGKDADAREIAEKLSGIYTEVSDTPTPEEIAEKTREFLGSMLIEGEPELSRVRRGGKASLSFTVKTQGYAEEKRVGMQSIRLVAGDETRDSVLPEPLEFVVPAEGTAEVVVPLLILPTLEPGDYAGTLELTYSTDEHFKPTVFDVPVAVNTFFRNAAPFLIPGAALLLAALVLAVVFLARRAGQARITFRLAVEEFPLKRGTDTFTLGPGRSLYIQEAQEKVSALPNRTKRSAARLYVEEGTLHIEILEPKSFPELSEAPKSALGLTTVLRSERGQDLHIAFLPVE